MSRARIGWLALALALAGCAAAPEVNAPLQTAAQRLPDQAFDASGRLAVNYQGKGEVASFDWQHAAAHDQLDVKTPIGNTVASLRRDRDGVVLKANGKAQYAADVETLTEATLGWPLPLSNLAWWARGHAAPDWPASYADDGRLQQQGWLIRNTQDADTRLPRRLELEREGMSIRLVFSRWQWQTEPQP